MAIHTIQDSNALLLYRVGPVLVCSATMSVETVIMPPKLTVPPGANIAEPGVFKSIHGIVRLVDLRVRFGVEKEDCTEPGRIVIVEVEGGHAGFWVDEIEDVISQPEKGWVNVPPYIPRHVFTRALLQNEEIRLYADFEQLDKFKTSGYLRKHIEVLQKIKEDSKCVNENNNSLNKTQAVVGEQQVLKKAPGALHEKKTEISASAGSEEKTAARSEIGTENKPAAKLKPKSETKPDKVERLNVNDEKIEKNSKCKDNGPEIKIHRVNLSVQKQNKTDRSDAKLRQYSGVKIKQKETIAAHKETVNKQSVNLHEDRNVQEPVSKPGQIQANNEKQSGWLWPLSALIAFALVVYFVVFPFVVYDRGVVEKNIQIKTNDNPVDTNEQQLIEVEEMSGNVINEGTLDAVGGGEVLGEVPVLVEKNVMQIVQKIDNEMPEEVDRKAEREVLDDENISLHSGNVKISKNDEGLLIVVNEFLETAAQEEIEMGASARGIEIEEKASDNEKVAQLTNAFFNEKTEVDETKIEKINAGSLSDINDTKKVIERRRDNKVLEKPDDQRSVSDVQIIKNLKIKKDKIAQPVQSIYDNKPIRSEKFIHVVVKNDTLWHIAKKYVHNPWRYPELAKLSNIKNPDLIYPGDRVTIIINYRRNH